MMNHKKSLKKLALNKKTVINLNPELMDEVRGGAVTLLPSCLCTHLCSVIVDSICKCYTDE